MTKNVLLLQNLFVRNPPVYPFGIELAWCSLLHDNCIPLSLYFIKKRIWHLIFNSAGGIMKRNSIVSLGCLLVWALASAAVAETRYFDQWGNEVSYKQYQETTQAWYARLDELKGPKVRPAATSVGTAPVRAPITTASAPSSPAPTVENTTYLDTVPRDAKGRPLKDDKGRWITYQDQTRPKPPVHDRNKVENYITGEDVIAFGQGASGMYVNPGFR